MYYGTVIIQKIGIKIESISDKNTMSILFNIPLAFINSFGTLLSIFYLDNLGRRFILLRTIPGVMISLLLVSFSMYLTTYYDGSLNQFGYHCT